MEDISQKISDLLASADGLDRIKAVAANLLGDDFKGNEQPTQKENNDFSLPQNLLENMGNIQGIMKVAGLLGNKQTDSRIDLLNALKPHLSVERAKRVDKAISILKIATILPILREEGLLDSFGF